MGIFRDLSGRPGSKARMVTSKGGADEDGDGREVNFALFPQHLKDEVVLGFVVESRKGREPVRAAECCHGGDERSALDEMLDAVLGNIDDEAARMAWCVRQEG